MTNSPSVLHGYFRSSAAWRVRIALNLKRLPVTQISHHLPRSEQTAPDYLTLNPQGLVPAYPDRRHRADPIAGDH
jgi:maleylpyruvate isomerase